MTTVSRCINRRRPLYKNGVILGFVSAACHSPVQAQSSDFTFTRWAVGAFGSVESSVYAGADSETSIYPLLEWQYKRFSWERTRFLYALVESENIEISPLIALEFDGYEMSDSPLLAGLDDRESGITVGFEWEVEVDLLEVGGEFRQDVSGASEALQAELGLGIDLLRTERLAAGFAVGVQWNSSRYNNYYFGIDAADASENRPAYAVGDSLSPFLEISALYQITDYWSAGIQVETTALDSVIADSPIVDTDNILEIEFGVRYEFYK